GLHELALSLRPLRSGLGGPAGRIQTLQISMVDYARKQHLFKSNAPFSTRPLNASQHVLFGDVASQAENPVQRPVKGRILGGHPGRKARVLLHEVDGRNTPLPLLVHAGDQLLLGFDGRLNVVPYGLRHRDPSQPITFKPAAQIDVLPAHAFEAIVEPTHGLQVFLPYGSVGRVERGTGEVPDSRLVPRQSGLEGGHRKQLTYRENLRPRVSVRHDM